MTYTPTVWSGTTAITALQMNHLEGQYDAFVTDLGTHDHDTDFYTKTLSDAAFFHTGNMGAGSDFDSDMLDGQHITYYLDGTLPVGTVLIWHGTASPLPANWALCTGQTIGGQLTPNLQNRFVVGAGSTYVNGAYGGASDFTPTATLTIANYALTWNEMPAHDHSYVDEYNSAGVLAGSGGGGPRWSFTSTTRTTSSIGSGQAHGHTGSIATFAPIDANPPYRAMYYIMKYK